MSDEPIVLYEIKKNVIYPLIPLLGALAVLLVIVNDVYTDGFSFVNSHLTYFIFLFICLSIFVLLTIGLAFPRYNLRLTQSNLSINLRLQGRSRLKFNEVINMKHRYTPLQLRFLNIFIPLNDIREI